MQDKHTATVSTSLSVLALWVLLCFNCFCLMFHRCETEFGFVTCLCCCVFPAHPVVGLVGNDCGVYFCLMCNLLIS